MVKSCARRYAGGGATGMEIFRLVSTIVAASNDFTPDPYGEANHWLWLSPGLHQWWVINHVASRGCIKRCDQDVPPRFSRAPAPCVTAPVPDKAVLAMMNRAIIGEYTRPGNSQERTNRQCSSVGISRGRGKCRGRIEIECLSHRWFSGAGEIMCSGAGSICAIIRQTAGIIDRHNAGYYRFHRYQCSHRL